MLTPPFFSLPTPWRNSYASPCSVLLLLVVSIVAAGSGRSAAIAGEIEVERDIEYSNPKDHAPQAQPGAAQKDRRPGARRRLHSWRRLVAGDRDRWQAACEELARRGFVAVTVQYRLAPALPFPAAIEDVQAAVRWLRANAERLKVDPNRIGALGDSAGGHLTQCLAVGADADRPGSASGTAAAGQSCRVQCVVNIYGPNDLTSDYPNPGVEHVIKKFLGGDVEQAKHNYILASPFYWVTPDAAPTLIIHGTKDDIVPYEQGHDHASID